MNVVKCINSLNYCTSRRKEGRGSHWDSSVGSVVLQNVVLEGGGREEE